MHKALWVQQGMQDAGRRWRALGGAGGHWDWSARRAWWDPEPWRVHPTTLLHPLPARSASMPETWARFTQENLQRAERERLASFNLRGLIDCILRDTSEDLRLQCDSVNLAFGRRLEELEDAHHKLQHHLNKVRGCTQASPRVWVPTARERPGSCAPPLPPPGHCALVRTRPGPCSSSAPPS